MSMNIRVAATALCLIIPCGCAARAGSSASERAVPIVVKPATTPAQQSIFSGSASIEAAHEYHVAFEIPGRVTDVYVEVGDRVTAGSALARLDEADYRARLAMASAQVDAAQAQERESAASAGSNTRTVAQSQLDEARAALNLAAANAHRAQMLYAQGAISAQDRDAAVSGEQQAQAKVNEAAAAVSATLDRTSAAVASFGAAQSQQSLAALALQKTVLTAPADAYVEQRSIEPGDEAAPGVPAFVLIASSPPEAVASVPQDVAGDIHAGTTATLTVGTSTYTLSVTHVEPQSDPMTRTVQVHMRGTIPSDLRGSIGTVNIGLHRSHGAAIPIGALLTSDDGEQYVELADIANRTVRDVPVRVLSMQGQDVVVSGIRPGTPIVVQGQHEARAGAPVVVVQR